MADIPLANAETINSFGDNFGNYFLVVEDGRVKKISFEAMKAILLAGGGTPPTTPTQPAALTLSGAATPATTYGGSDGSVKLTAGGGTVPYTYQRESGAFQASDTFSGLSSANHSFTVKDYAGITKTISVFVGQPAAPAVYDTELNNTTQEGAGSSFNPGESDRRIQFNNIPNANASLIFPEIVRGGVSSYLSMPGEYAGKPFRFFDGAAEFNGVFSDGLINF